MKILSIDPGYERLGIAILEKTQGKKDCLLFSECFKTDPKLPFEDRLLEIGNKIEDLLIFHKPSVLSIETLFFSKNTKTAMRVAETRGTIIYIAKKNNLIVREINPMEIKLAVTGDGKSDKHQMIKMVQLILKIDKKATDDEYDAIACGLACCAFLKY
ncbi:MAG: crossover junction endodeoxyribonuclease RuvC [bacterium]